MSEGQQEVYKEDQSSGGQQHQLADNPDYPTGDQSKDSPKQSSHKRKRDSIDNGTTEEGRTGSESASSRRTSFKQTSPNMPAAFLPINPNMQQDTANQYQAYPPLTQAQAQNMNGSSSQDASNAALAVNAMNSLMPQLNAQQAGMSGMSGEQLQMDGSYQISPQPSESHTEGVGVRHVPAPQSVALQQTAPTPNPKPQVGTEEWHRVRRDNHKEVERRRRETINEGINELAKIVPGCEKNKGSILQRAVQYIQELKDNETQNIQKWTLEKLLTEQAIQELSQNNEKLQKECERAWREADTWKKSCLQAGVTGGGGGESGGQSGSS